MRGCSPARRVRPVQRGEGLRRGPELRPGGRQPARLRRMRGLPDHPGRNHSDVAFVRTEKVTITIDEAATWCPPPGTGRRPARWRIIVVEDADRMAERTTNVLLKAIEEPTPRPSGCSARPPRPTSWSPSAPAAGRWRCGSRPPPTSRPCWSSATAWTRAVAERRPGQRRAMWDRPPPGPGSRSPGTPARNRAVPAGPPGRHRRGADGGKAGQDRHRGGQQLQ